MHPNAKTLRESDEAMARGDTEAFMGYFTEDIVVHLGGKSMLAGTYKGKGEFVSAFTKFMERSPEYSFENHSYLADDVHGVVLQRSHYKRGDERLDTNEMLVCHFKQGKISEMWLYSEDQNAVDSFIG